MRAGSEIPVTSAGPSLRNAAALCLLWSASTSSFGGRAAYAISQTGSPGSPAVSITEYAVPTSYSNPHSITAGPDGALWFTELGRKRIGRISTDGVITEYPSTSGDGITAGADGALWFTDLYGNLIGRISTDGAVTSYSVPTPRGGPFSITSGPDGALWFTEILVYKVGRITTSGVFTEYDLPAGSRQSLGITAGPDGALWYDAIEGSSTPSLSVGFPSPTKSGNLILAAVRTSTATAAVTLSDSAGNVYSEAVAARHDTDPHQVHIFYASNIAGGANTVTAAFSSTNDHPWLAIYEFSGLSTTNPLDQTAHAQGFGSVPSCGPTSATATANELVFAMVGLQAPFYGTAAPGSGYALQLQDTGSSPAATEAAIATSRGSYTCSLSLSEPTYWTAVVATFRTGGETAAPTITTSSLPDGAQDRPYTAALAATGGAAPYAWSLASGSLPDGLNLGSSTGVITGAPTTPGTSSFTVRATDSNSRTATGALSITIHPESPAIVEENDPSVGYTGTWYAVSAPFTHGGGAVLATEEGASATIRFAGTGIRWVGLSDEWSGIAFVYVDGVLLEPRDTYRTPGEAQVVEYGVGGLTGGTHALTIVVTGRQNPASGGAWIWVDAFVIQP